MNVSKNKENKRMAIATATPENNQQALLLSEELYFLPISEIKNTKQLNELTSFYIREEPSPEAVAKMKRALNVGGDTVHYQVIEPLIFWKNPEGDLYTVSGNTRRRSIIELLNETDEDGSYKNHPDLFDDVPYRLLLTEPTTDILLDIQFSTNDNTTPHTPLELAKKAEAYREEKQREFLAFKPNANKNEVKTYATSATTKRFNVSGGYLSQLKKLLNAVSNPKNEALKALINSNEISPDTAIKLLNGLDKTDMSLDQVIPGLRQQLGTKENKITEKHVKAFFDAMKVDVNTSNKNNETGEDDENIGANSNGDNPNNGVTSTSSNGTTTVSGNSQTTKPKEIITFDNARRDFGEFLDFLRNMPEINVENGKVAYDLLKLYFELLEVTSDKINSNYTSEIFNDVIKIVLTRFSRLGEENFDKEIFTDDKERDGIDRILRKINKQHSSLVVAEGSTTEVIEDEAPTEEMQVTVTTEDEEQLAMIS